MSEPADESPPDPTLPPTESGLSPSIDLRSVFLGPKGENAAVFERLLLEAFRDHVFWRRNVHPEDGFRVQEVEKRSPSYQYSISVLEQTLLSLLGELKGGVPFFSPRYIGHMTSDLTMASLIGYFATMLYNPNNVAVEGSPVTTRLELEVAEDLGAMVGYPAADRWGHLTSGGTVANFEALWVARNVKYLPIAVRWAAEELQVGGLTATSAAGSKDLGTLSLWELLNLPPRESLDLLDRLLAATEDRQAAAEAVSRHSASGMGYQSFGYRLHQHFGDALPPAVVLVPSTAHYSFEKICRALGMGGNQLVHVPVDENFRMDPAALWRILQDLAQRQQPVVAVVSVLGTTEESAVDRVDRVEELRTRAGEELGLAWHHHVDAAWGGYALSVTRDAAGRRRGFQSTLADQAPEAWPSESVYRALVAVEQTDSVTIDPHKFGFIPYPAGAVCFRDRRSRELVSVEAPYVFHSGAPDSAHLGRFILEGSKPGAAAAAVWMAHQVLPLDARGYGRLIGASSRGALALHRRLAAGDFSPFHLSLLPPPDLNIVCFAVGHPSLGTLSETNQFVHRLYQALSLSTETTATHRVERPDYFVTKTVLRAEEYGGAAVPVAARLGFDEAAYREAGGVAVLRCTVMDPFLAASRDRVDYLEGFAATLRQVMVAALATG